MERKETNQCMVTVLFFLLMVVAASATWPSPAAAQSADTGALTGTITDPSGSIISGAEIEVTNISTAQTRTTLSGANGTYRIPLLPPGKYAVKVRMSGFQTAEFPAVTINVTETAVLNCTMAIGTPTETVTVAADAEILETSTSTLGTLVDSEKVVALPLTTRNYTQILDLSAGVSASVANATELGKGTQQTSVNGSNPAQNNYQMDGVAINSIASLGHASDQNVGAGIGIPNPDALQEFKIQTSTFDASYGRNPGASVNVVTKSGTNELHGTGFYFLRGTSLNANPFFYNRERKPTNLRSRFSTSISTASLSAARWSETSSCCLAAGRDLARKTASPAAEPPISICLPSPRATAALPVLPPPSERCIVNWGPMSHAMDPTSTR